MKLAMYHIWKTFVSKYFFGLLYLSWFYRETTVEPIVIVFFYNIFFNLMVAWTPFKEGSIEEVLYSPDPIKLTILGLLIGILFCVISYYNGNLELGFLLASQILRSSFESNLKGIKYLERLVIDFLILLSVLLLNQLVNVPWIYPISILFIAALNFKRYYKCINYYRNPLNILRIKE